MSNLIKLIIEYFQRRTARKIEAMLEEQEQTLKQKGANGTR